MINYLVKKYIDDYDDYKNQRVRQAYGTLCSILSIICNIVLVIFKITIGLIVHSVAIQADGLNNFSDVGSNLASLFGFKLANKHPDKDHPYGHGRYEYIAGMIIAFLILVVGIQSLKESVVKIFVPEKVTFSIVAVIILVVSIFIKLWMYYFNHQIGNKIDSSSLKAAGQDSLNDVVTTFATLVALLLTLITDLPVDGIIGTIVSIIVILAGINVFKDTINPLLGLAPDKALIDSIENFIMSYEKPLGIHDLMMHDYGPGRMFMTLHVEVDSREDIMKIHEEIDDIERAIQEKYHIHTTIHYDPVDIHNPQLLALKQQVLEIVQHINENYSIHDFRMVKGTTRTNLIFDVEVPRKTSYTDNEIMNSLKEQIHKLSGSRYFAVIQIDHEYY